MICEHCHKENRSVAKFCKWCGSPLASQDILGYTITNMTTKQVTRFNFNAEDNSWSLENNGEEIKLFTFVDDTHVDVITRDGSYTRVELSQAGVLAYQDLVGIGGTAFALK